MRHGLSGRQLSRNAPHRSAMLRNMAASLLRHETIRTTIPKAKELRRVVEPLITLGKEDSEANRRLAFSRLRDAEVVDQAVRRPRPALQGASGRLHAHPAHGAACRRQRRHGADAAGRPAAAPVEARRPTKTTKKPKKAAKKKAAPAAEAAGDEPARRSRARRARRRPPPTSNCSRLPIEGSRARARLLFIRGLAYRAP